MFNDQLWTILCFDIWILIFVLFFCKYIFSRMVFRCTNLPRLVLYRRMNFVSEFIVCLGILLDFYFNKLIYFLLWNFFTQIILMQFWRQFVILSDFIVVFSLFKLHICRPYFVDILNKFVLSVNENT